MSKALSRVYQRRSRLLRRTVVVLFCLPLVLWALGNFIGATSPGTGFFEKQIEKRLGFSSEISSLSWTPWGGVKVHHLTLFSEGGDESLVEVDLIQIDPSWSSMLKGEKRFDELLIEGVQMDLTLEKLKKMMAARSSTSKAVDQPKEKKIEIEQVNDEKVAVKKVDRPEGDKKKPVSEGRKAAPVIPIDDFQGLITLRDVNVKLSSENSPDLAVTFSDIKGEIPLWGKERSGKIVFSGIQIGKDGNEERLELPIKWSGGVVKFEEPKVHLLGVRLGLSGSLRLVHDLPYGLVVDLPSQRINFTSMGKNAPPLDFWLLESKNILQGYVMAPSLIYGSSQTKVGTVILHDRKDESEVRFERGFAEASLNPSGLYSRQFYLIGDEEAVLGNGFVSTAGEGAATVRVVASPERAQEYEKRVRSGSPDWSLAFQPLVTPDRVYRDLRFDLTNGGLWVNLKKDGEEIIAIPFQEVFGRIRVGQVPPVVPTIP
ncbi:hypothetical protein N9F50_01915 [Akkermansiaceae bacterium]|nr:hypothetical protein [Akkermansiaceae bacterium]MDB4508219.1 hypothetical protein [Akkermansiaceae bacterium]